MPWGKFLSIMAQSVISLVLVIVAAFVITAVVAGVVKAVEGDK